MASTLARPPFHRAGWVYDEKVAGWRIVAYRDSNRVRLISSTPSICGHRRRLRMASH
jgi:hypothetical protein